MFLAELHSQGLDVSMIFNKEEKQLARERDHYLVQICTDGSERVNPGGILIFTGPLPPECHAELWAMVQRWTDEGRV